MAISNKKKSNRGEALVAGIRAIGVAFVLNVAFAAAASSQSLPAGLVAHYTFDDGTASDVSGNGLHGTMLGNAAIIADPERGNVLSLTGAGGKVDLGNPAGLNITGELSVAAWVKPASLPQPQANAGILQRGHGGSPSREFVLRISGGTSYDFGTWSPNQHASFQAPAEDLNTWVHLAGTMTDEGGGNFTYRLYRNGEEVASLSNAVGMLDFTVGWAIGARGGVGGFERVFDGQIDDLQIYEVALSEAQIVALMVGGPVESEIPIAADFGSVRFIEFLDQFTPAPFELAAIHAGETFYTNEAHTVTALPEPLAGKLAIKTSNELPESVLEFGGGSAQTYVDTNLDPAGLEFPLSFSIWTHRFDDGTARNKIWGWFFDGGANRGELEMDTRGGSNNSLRLAWWGGGRINVPLPPTGQWVHLGVVMTADDARLYVDGVLAGTLAEELSPLPLVDGSDLWIGARPNPANHEGSFSGWLKDWIVFDGDIGDEGMQQLANGNEVPAFDIIQHLPMNEAEGDVVFDSSAPQINGDLVGPEWTTTTPFFSSALASNIGFVVDRDVTVSIAYDANTAVPAWIADHYSDSGLTVQTTGGEFKLWQKDFQARDHVMLLASEREEGDNNYWVILDHAPDAITQSPDGLFARSAADRGDWALRPHDWRLETAADAEQNTAGMLTAISNFDQERGFTLTTRIRVPRLQDSGDNAFGFVLLGDPEEESAGAIRAEWLPRTADGTSALRLVDASDGSVLSGAETVWTGLAPTAINNDVGVGSGATEVVFGTGSEPFTDVAGAPLSENFEGGGTGWTSGSHSGTPNQWEIGVPTSGPGSAYVGQNVAATRLDGGYAANSASWLRSPVVDLTGATEPTLRYHEYLHVDTFVEGGVIFHFATISVLDADTLEALDEVAIYSAHILEWTPREIDLSDYAGEQIVLEFNLYSDSQLLDDWQGWYLDNIQVTGDGAFITSMPENLALDGSLNGIATENAALAETSASHLQFTIADRAVTGNDGVTVFVAWDTRASGLEPDWLRNDFTSTDHFVGVANTSHRLWAREYESGDTVILGGASAPGGGPFPEHTNNYFVLFGDVRTGLESYYTLSAEGAFEEGTWSIDFSLTDANEHSQTVSGTVSETPGNQFGLFARHPDAVGSVSHPPVWEVADLSIGFLKSLAGFESWRELHFPDDLGDPGISGPSATPAGDGVSNIVKYALDLPPWEPVSSQDLPQGDITEEGNLILVYWERTDIDDIEYIPQVSEDLVNWESGAPYVMEVLRQTGAEANIEEVGVVGEISEDARRAFFRLMIRQKE